MVEAELWQPRTKRQRTPDHPIQKRGGAIAWTRGKLGVNRES